MVSSGAMVAKQKNEQDLQKTENFVLYNEMVILNGKLYYLRGLTTKPRN